MAGQDQQSRRHRERHGQARRIRHYPERKFLRRQDDRRKRSMPAVGHDRGRGRFAGKKDLCGPQEVLNGDSWP